MLSERVDHGISVLDKKLPDWRGKVDCAILDMYSHKDCVLGQVFESYYVGTQILQLDDEDVVSLGFEVDDPDEQYKDLTDEWKRQLTGSNT